LESIKKYYDTSAYCNSIRGTDGMPLNVKIQEDVHEFFNLLIDQIEARLKSTGD